MQRICTTLAGNGFQVILVGRRNASSKELTQESFTQKRLYCFFSKGFLFYAEYNLKLFFWLLFQKVDIICAVDLDTILPCYFVSVFRKKQRVYDAHELFTEQKEIVTRRFIHRFWLGIEKFAVPKFKLGYTVNNFIAEEFYRRYKVQYEVIKNLPRYYTLFPPSKAAGLGTRFIIYQGAVNEGRGFETLIPAMKQVNCELRIYGKGNFYQQTKQLIIENNLEDKVLLKGFLLPEQLKQETQKAYIGVTIFESTGLNQFYSLSNRFFDYIMAGIPQVCVNYPEYKAINDMYNIAVMIDEITSTAIATAINSLLENEQLYKQLRQNCVISREAFSWEEEEKKLLAFYNDRFK